MTDNSGIGAKLAGLARRLGRCLAAPIDPQVNYPSCCTNVQSFRDEAKKLGDTIIEIEEKVTQAVNKAQIIPPNVRGWLEDAEKIKRRMEEIDVSIHNVQGGCLPIKSQFLLSKKDKETVEALEKILEDWNFLKFSLPTSKAPVPLGPIYEWNCPSRIQFEETVRRAFGEKRVIGISGMGGIGKTTMAEKLVQRVTMEKLFDKVLMVVVGPHMDALEIQRKIAEGLGLSSEGRTLLEGANALRHMLTGDSTMKILIVMDDLWYPVQVENFGIPCEGGTTACTVLLTSRSTKVLKEMNADVFSMQILDEAEAWSLFRTKVGNLVDDQKLLAIAKQIVSKCKGLPLPLGILGGLLKDARSIEIWEDALHGLKSSNPGIPCFLEKVYPSLRLSYEHLNHSDAEFLFLLCSIFPEDSDINLNVLTMYCMSVNLFSGISKVEETRKRVFRAIEMLKSSSLLLDGKSIGFVKMHDVVRGVAIFIAREKDLVDASVKSPSVNESKWIISSPRTRIELDDCLARIDYPRISLLGIHCLTRPLIINDLPCLEGMQELKSLSLSNISFKLLPQAIKRLQNLRMLYLVDCMTLESISMVGELLQLEILMCQLCYKIKELPVEMRSLKRLKVLEFVNCSNLERVAPGVISNLVELEELKMVHSFKGWEQTKVKDKELRNASLKELESLTKLMLLWIEIADVGLVEEEINISSSIVNYRIIVGNMSPWIHNKFEKVVSFAGLPQDIHCGNWIQQIVRSTDEMHLEGDGSMNFDMSQLHSSINFLRLGKCKRVAELVNTTTTMPTDDCGAFPKLESLMLENLPDLRRIFVGPVPEASVSFRKLFYLYLRELPGLISLWKIPNQNASLSNLREVILWKCNKLQNVFFLESGKDVLFELRSLQIHECDMLEEVFYSEIEEDINDGTNSSIASFPKLEILKLDSLPSLRTFVKRLGYIKFPLLTDLHILYCPMLTGFISDGSEQNSLCDREKVGFGSKLKRLLVSEHQLCNLLISHGLFRELEELVVQGWKSTESLFSSSMAENFVNIKHLTIEQCYMKEVIANEIDLENMEKVIEIKVHEVAFEIFPVLECLQLYDLPRLKLICDSTAYEEFNVFKNLRELHLENLPALKHLGNSSYQGGSLISNLSRVTIYKCDELCNLFSWTMSKEQLMQLECLIIESCDMMKHVFSSNEENGKSSCITFSKLNELVLRNLKSLETFCTGVENVDFPVLEEMTICNCPDLRSIVSSTGCNGTDEHGDDSSHMFCCPQPTFGELKKLWIMEFHYANIWCHQIRPYFMGGLKELFIQDCGEIKTLFSSSIAEILVNLKGLVIEHCNKMESVIGDEGSADDTYILFPCLTELTLHDLPLVSNFCEWSCSIELPLLDYISIENCPQMKFFTMGSSRAPNLEQITLDGHYFSIEEVDEMGGLNGIITKMIMPPSSTSAEDISDIPPSSYLLPIDKESGSAEEISGTKDSGKVARKTDVEKSNEVDPEEPLDVVVEKDGYMRECLLYCSLFPANYEFSRDILIWSWIAAGLTSEAEAIGFFDRLIKQNYILQSGYDHMGDQMKYKVENGNLFHKIKPSEIPYRKMVDIGKGGVDVQHLSLIFEQINQIESIRKYTQLKTLLLHRCWGSEFLNLFQGLIFDLKLLTKLDLSGTNIEELPCSVENLKALRYLDVSDTPIKWLPESVDSLDCLETLILLRCLSLYGLPKCMYKLVKLKHLIVDLSQLLRSMPIQIGKLTDLQTLGAFVIGTKDGSGIGELGNMNKLKGSLCLVKLENILNMDEAREARLWDKQYLSKLEFRWGDLEDAKVTRDEEILENLRPHSGLRELKIVSYSGGVLPLWISDPSFDQITSITLHECRYCEELPSLGELPSLKSLKIVDMDALLRIDKLFCQKQDNAYQQPFPKLERLSLEGLSNLETWTGVEDGHFPCLKQLLIKYCQKLVALPNLSYLKSLQHLEICDCPKLSCLPEMGLLASLQSLMVSDCPILKDRCCNGGEDWAKVAGVPTLYIDHQKII